MDKGGLAEMNGIRVGDQIANVNGDSFENITHTQAVMFMKNQRHLIMTIRSVQRYPAYKKAPSVDDAAPLVVHRRETESRPRGRNTTTSKFCLDF